MSCCAMSCQAMGNNDGFAPWVAWEERKKRGDGDIYLMRTQKQNRFLIGFVSFPSLKRGVSDELRREYRVGGWIWVNRSTKKIKGEKEERAKYEVALKKLGDAARGRKQKKVIQHISSYREWERCDLKKESMTKIKNRKPFHRISPCLEI